MPEKRPEIDDINTEQGLIGLGTIPSLAPVAAFNPKQVENLLRTKGLRALHFKHAPNPDRETLEGGVNPNTVAAKYGWRFYSVRQLRVVAQQFKLEDRLNVQGIWGTSSVLLNVAGHYDDYDQEHVFVRPYDVIMLQSTADGGSITMQTEQFTEFNPTGPQKLNFRCEAVDYLADKNRVYIPEQDFITQNGNIVWLDGGYKPSFKDGKGDILSVVYWIKPIYIVQNVPHAIRITPGNDTGNGALPRQAYYAPQLVIAKQAWQMADAEEMMNYDQLPEYPHYRNSNNVTGGSI